MTVGGHHTSVSLEDPFWDELKRIAEVERISIATLIERIDRERGEENLSSALRLAILADLKRRLAAADQLPRSGSGSPRAGG